MLAWKASFSQVAKLLCTLCKFFSTHSFMSNHFVSKKVKGKVKVKSVTQLLEFNNLSRTNNKKSIENLT